MSDQTEEYREYQDHCHELSTGQTQAWNSTD